MATRLFVVLARDAPVGVVFRRGPSKQVLLVRWNLTSDTFEAGQWFKGRIYEEKSDLSPNGDQLVYFAANHRPPFHTWTAVSRPPFLTAVALWPQSGTYGGGGLFLSQNELCLNASAHGRIQPADGFTLPKQIQIDPETGLFDPYAERLQRRGWTQLQKAGKVRPAQRSPRVTQPEIWSRPCPRTPRWELRMITEGNDTEPNGPWKARRFELDDGTASTRADLGPADWADWATTGDLLMARDGVIHRAPLASLGRDGSVWTSARALIDLSALKFVACAPPPEATHWFGPPPAGRRL